MSDYYSVSAEGNAWAWTDTKGATEADFAEAVAEARKRSAGDSNYVVRYNNGRGESRIVCTLVNGEVVWLRLASPPVRLGE